MSRMLLLAGTGAAAVAGLAHPAAAAPPAPSLVALRAPTRGAGHVARNRLNPTGSAGIFGTKR